MIVINNLINLYHAGFKVSLYPGMNVIPDTEWTAAKLIAAVDALVDNGSFEEIADDDKNTWTLAQFRTVIECIVDEKILDTIYKDIDIIVEPETVPPPIDPQDAAQVAAYDLAVIAAQAYADAQTIINNNARKTIVAEQIAYVEKNLATKKKGVQKI